MKRKELLWMLMPCLLLLGGGWYFSRKDANPRKFRVVIESIGLVTATPRDVARGYDTVVLTKMRMTGPRNIDFSDTRKNSYGFYLDHEVVDAQGRRVKNCDSPGYATVKYSPTYYEEQVTYLLKLSQVPKSAGALYCRVSANGVVMDQRTSKHLHDVVTPIQKLLVRRAGEVIKAPIVKKYRPFKVIGYEITPFPRSSTCRLIISVEPFETLQYGEGRGPIAIDNARIVADDKIIPDRSGVGHGGNNTPLYLTKTLKFPPKCRTAIFKGDLSINNCWPLPLAITIRKNGETLKRNQSTRAFKFP